MDDDAGAAASATIADGPHGLSSVLYALARDPARERIAIADLLATLGRRALGGLLFLFAVPNVLPVPPGTSGVLGLPLIFLAAQLTLGARPWLPALLTRWSVARADFARLVERIGPWLERAEKMLRPRLPALARPPADHLIGLVCFALSLVLLLPVPLGNVLPALAISVLALGLLQRDGVWVLAGLGVAAVALLAVSGVVWAMFQGIAALLARGGG